MYPLPNESKRLKVDDGRYMLVNMAGGTVLEANSNSKVAQGCQMNGYGYSHQMPTFKSKTRRLDVVY